jgi:hydroxymethylbilane synthase
MAGHGVSLLELVTSGDRWSAASAADATKGLFVRELEEALLDGRADLAVHSAKDLPGALPDGLAILAMPKREDPRDVLVGPEGGLAALASGARVGTGSPRRTAQLRLIRPDVTFAEIRGNVGTRLEKLARGETDALVLAAAGLIRLGLNPEGLSALHVAVSVPAPGQGALALEGRRDRPELATCVAVLDDPATSLAVRAERALLAGLGGGCREPVGALGTVEGDTLRLVAFAASADGAVSVRHEASGPADDPEALGAALAAIIGRRLAGG